MLKIHILCALLHSAFGQYFDPANGMLMPARIPTQLYTINAPVYVEPQNLQPLYRRELIGPPMVSAPFVGPPVVSEPFVGPPILSAPSPYDYAYRPMQLMYDEQQDEVNNAQQQADQPSQLNDAPAFSNLARQDYPGQSPPIFADEALNQRGNNGFPRPVYQPNLLSPG